MERTETETLDTGVLMDADGPEKPVTPVCENCNADLADASAIYCPQCGHHIRGIKHYDTGSESLSANIKPLLVFFVLDLLITTASHIDSLVKSYSNVFVFELLSAILTTAFVIYSWSSLKHLFTIRRFDTNLILLIPGTIICSIIVNAIITKLNAS